MYTCEQLRRACRSPWPRGLIYDQSTWGKVGECGTACCLHGRVVYEATGRIATTGPSDDDYTDHGLPGRAARGLLYWPGTRPEHVVALLDLPARATARDCARTMLRTGVSIWKIVLVLYDAECCGLSPEEVRDAISDPDGCGIANDLAQQIFTALKEQQTQQRA